MDDGARGEVNSLRQLHVEPSDPSPDILLSDHANPIDPKKTSLGGTSERAALIDACRQASQVSSIAKWASSSGGLLDDEVRRIAWPRFLGLSTTHPKEDKRLSRWQDLPKHKDEDQVKLDVNRSFIYYPSNESEKQLEQRKADLSDVITEVLRRHPMLCYFQGFHDIVQVILLVLGKEIAADAVAHLSLFRIRDFMLPSLSPSLAHLRLLPAILHCVDAKLCQHISRTQPFFALAATLTLYAHEIQEYGDIARLYDFLLSHEAVVSVYLFAGIIISRKDELLDIPEDEPEMLHFTLSKLPKPLNLESLISQSLELYTKHPPERLPFRAWRQVSSYSVLKTTRSSLSSQTLLEGEILFAKQAVQLRRGEIFQRVKAIMWKYRKPAGGVGLALFVGVLSYWIQRRL